MKNFDWSDYIVILQDEHIKKLVKDTNFESYIEVKGIVKSRPEKDYNHVSKGCVNQKLKVDGADEDQV